jgi:hypothetical protein
MGKPTSLSVQNAWNSVALEERLELISRCQANGLVAALTFALMMGSVAYGYDKFYLLTVALGGALLVHPMFSSYTWRRAKPALIMQYLAVRSMARRYAYGFSFNDLDVVIIFRGEMVPQFANEEAEMDYLSKQAVDLEHGINDPIQVWICLMRGGLVLLSERVGGAKLEFITPIARDVVARQSSDPDGNATGTLSISGVGPSKGKSVMIRSRYPAAMYVFERQIQRLIVEAPETITILSS